MKLPRGWVTAGTNLELWGKAGTYKAIPVEALPPIEGPLDGTFAWLPAASRSGMLYGSEHAPPPAEGAIAAQLDALAAEARRAGLELPPALGRFILDPVLRERIPSCTACYWELGARLVPIPGHDGPERLLRFMNDQQICYLWYLVLAPGGGHEVAHAWPELTKAPGATTLEDATIPRDLTICAASVEEFLRRLWIESTLWFARPGEALAPELGAYAEAARRAVAGHLVPA